MNFFEKETRRAEAASSYIKIAVILICAVTLCSSVMLTVLNKTFIGESGLYLNSAPTALPVILALLSVAVCFYGTMNIRKASRLEMLPRASRRTLSVISFLFIAQFFAIFIIYLLLGPLDIQYGVTNSLELAEKMKAALICYEILIPLSLFAPVYFVLAAFKRQINALFGSVTLIWILLYILRLYFDVTDWVMSPRKLTMICAMCIAAIFILYEIRFALGRGSSRKYFFFTALSAIFCISCGSAGVCSIYFGVYPLNYELPYFGVALLIGVYALVRVLSFIPKKSEKRVYEDFDMFDEEEIEDKTSEKEETSTETL